MVKINKVTTSKGDDGFTCVIGAQRLNKNSVRIEALGSVDELQSWLGLLRVKFNELNEKSIHASLAKIQNDLFDLGSELACIDIKSPLPITKKEINNLEQSITKFNKNLPALRSFVLPGSSEIDAYMHISRTVCRRAERRIVQLTIEDKINPLIQIYLNRLSDLIFVWSRYIAFKHKIPEILWENRKNVRSRAK